MTVTERAEATGLAPSTSLYRTDQAKKPRLLPSLCYALRMQSRAGVKWKEHWAESQETWILTNTSSATNSDRKLAVEP